MNKSLFAAALAASIIVTSLASTAEAKHRHVASRSATQIVCNQQGCNDRVAPSSMRVKNYETASYSEGRIVAHPPGCPHSLFCGCGVSVRVFGHPVRDLFLALNWRKYPSASPGTGMVAYRSGHVFYIESVDASGNVVAYDPNSGGHLTRVHTVSLRGYHVVNPQGSRVSSNN